MRKAYKQAERKRSRRERAPCGIFCYVRLDGLLYQMGTGVPEPSA